jgi:hypothetical protein
MSPQSNSQSQEPPRRPVRPEWKGACDSLPPGGYLVEPGDRFIRGQLVVTGARGEIEDVIRGVIDALPSARGLPQWQIQEVDLGFLSGLAPPGGAGGPSGGPEEPPGEKPGTGSRFTDAQRADLVTRVYQLPDEDMLDQTIAAFYDGAIFLGFRVYAEPNYLISTPDVSDDIAGSSGCIEGGPAVPGVSITVPGTTTSEDLFWEQWAFGKEGLDFKPLKKPGGKNVRVAVFDTSPFPSPGKWHIPWLEKSDLDLCVSHPVPLAHTRMKDVDRDYSDHGLFVASLVHAVARKSDIRLIRVLNDQNLGEVVTLVKALRDVLWLDSGKGDHWLKGTVVNLSLGRRDKGESPQQATLNNVRNHIARLDRALFGGALSTGARIPVVGLESVLHGAYKAGAIIVAAAGNDSKGGLQPARAPASHPFVIGVAGHNIHQERSNFSNKGDIGAPGGDSSAHPHLIGSDGKVVDPNFWLIGLSMRSEPDHGYMYWMGTSFAAPLVSGLAARFLSEGVEPKDVRGAIRGAGKDSTDGDLGYKKAKVKP